MKSYERVLTDAEVEKANREGVHSLFSEGLLIGYGVYGAEIVEVGDKHILRYSLGDSCD